MALVYLKHSQVICNLLSNILKNIHLEQVSVVVVVDEDFQLLELVDVLDHLHLGPGQPLPQLVVVRVRDVEELGAARSQIIDLMNIGSVRILQI